MLDDRLPERTAAGRRCAGGRFIVGAGAQNLFDVFPDKTLPPNSNLGILTYPSSSPFGMNGRFIYSRLTGRF